MRPAPGPRWLLAGLAAALAGGVALAVTGTVKDAAGLPLAGVRVCHFQEDTGLELYCIETDERGYFDVISSDAMPIRVSAPGYFPQTLPARGHHEIVLEQSPTLTVRLVDTAGQPIAEGEVFVIYPTATKKGPFPARASGVRISRLLEPGEVRVIGRAVGYEDSAPLAVTLVRGKESEITLELRKRVETTR